MTTSEKLERVKILCEINLAPDVKKDIIKNLSGAAMSHQDKYLWLGTDELTAIERFTLNESGEYSDHARFNFKDFILDFNEDKGEVDVEGLDYNDGYLWIIGSHSSKRKKVKVDENKFMLEGKELKK